MAHSSLSRVAATLREGVQRSSTTTSQMQTPEEAKSPYERLPTELRTAIWEFVLLEPRIVFLRPKPLKGRRSRSHHYIQQIVRRRPYYHPEASYRLCSNTPDLKLILTCRAAYEVARKNYEWTFSTRVTPGRTMFNHSIDTLYIHWGTNISWTPRFDRYEASQVKYLAVYDNNARSRRRAYECGEDWIADILATFSTKIYWVGV